MFFIFVVGFVIPFLILQFHNDNIWLYMTICTITVTFFALIEVLQMVKLKVEYFKDMWNYLDVIFIVSWYSDYFIHMSSGFDKISELGYTNTIIIMNFLRMDVAIMSMLKIINFMRTFEAWASLIMLLKEVLKDLYYF
jgi:hypothetical protein